MKKSHTFFMHFKTFITEFLILEQEIIHFDTQIKAKSIVTYFYRQIKPKRLSHTIFTIEKIMYFLDLDNNDADKLYHSGKHHKLSRRCHCLQRMVE